MDEELKPIVDDTSSNNENKEQPKPNTSIIFNIQNNEVQPPPVDISKGPPQPTNNEEKRPESTTPINTELRNITEPGPLFKAIIEEKLEDFHFPEPKPPTNEKKPTTTEKPPKPEGTKTLHNNNVKLENTKSNKITKTTSTETVKKKRKTKTFEELTIEIDNAFEEEDDAEQKSPIGRAKIFNLSTPKKCKIDKSWQAYIFKLTNL